jgi:hypothetical protein
MPDTANVARFTRRVVIREAPHIVAQLERLAAERGHSVAAEVRHAVRRELDEVGRQREGERR